MENSEEELTKVVAENLSNLRKGDHLTQQELGALFGYSDKSISKWEKGGAIPSAYVLTQLADHYDVTVDYLLTKHDPTEAHKVQKEVRKKKNWVVLTSILFFFVWTIAAIVFGAQVSQGYEDSWVAFIFALPISLIFVSFMCYRYLGRKSWWLFSFMSIALWTGLLAFYIYFLEMNLWYIFVAGIPVQAILVLLRNYD